MQMEDSLATFCAFINHNTVAILINLFLFSDFSGHNHQMSKQSLMLWFSLTDSSQTVTVLRNDQEVSWSHWRNVSECQALVIFVDDSCRDFFSHNLVENGDFFCHLFFLIKLIIK